MLFCRLCPVQPAAKMAHCEPGVGVGEGRIELDRSLEQRASSFVALGRLVDQQPPEHKRVIGFKVRCPVPCNGARRRQHARKGAYDPAHDFVLQHEDVRQFAVEPVSPHVAAHPRRR